MKVKAEQYTGETELLKCALSHTPFEQEPGIKFVTDDGQPVSPHAAHAAGADLTPIRPPESVNSKSKLTAFMLNDLKLKRGTPAFSEYYKNYSPLFQNFE